MKKLSLILIAGILLSCGSVAADEITANLAEPAHPVIYAMDKDENTAWISSSAPEAKYRYLRIAKNERSEKMKAEDVANVLAVFEVKVFASTTESIEPVEICEGIEPYGSPSFNNKFPHANGNDGNENTQWFNADCGDDTVYWQVDLGDDFEKRNITAVQAVLGEGWADYPADTNFRIELSNDEDFEEAFTIYNNTTFESVEEVYIDLAKGPIFVDETGPTQISNMEPAKLKLDLGIPQKVNAIELLMAEGYASGFELRAAADPAGEYETLISRDADSPLAGMTRIETEGKMYSVIEIEGTEAGRMIGVAEIKIIKDISDAKVSGDRKVSGTAENLEALVDGKVGAAVSGGYADVDLGRRYPVTVIELVTPVENITDVQVYGANDPYFKDAVLITEFAADNMSGNGVYSVKSDGSFYRYIRATNAEENVSAAELNIYSSTKECIGEWTVTDETNVKLLVENYSEEDKNYTLLVMDYSNEGKLKNTEAVSKLIKAGKAANLEGDIAGLFPEIEAGDKVKFIAVENIANMNLLCEAFVVEVK